MSIFEQNKINQTFRSVSLPIDLLATLRDVFGVTDPSTYTDSVIVQQILEKWLQQMVSEPMPPTHQCLSCQHYMELDAPRVEGQRAMLERLLEKDD